MLTKVYTLSTNVDVFVVINVCFDKGFIYRIVVYKMHIDATLNISISSVRIYHEVPFYRDMPHIWSMRSMLGKYNILYLAVETDLEQFIV